VRVISAKNPVLEAAVYLQSSSHVLPGSPAYGAQLPPPPHSLSTLEKMDWQAPPRTHKLGTTPRKKALRTRKSSSSSEGSTSHTEPGEIKRKPAKKAQGEELEEKPSTSAALRKKLANNAFALLSSEEDEDDQESSDDEPGPKDDSKPKTPEKPKPTPKTIKPPPIFIPDVTNISALVKMITTLVGPKNNFTYKTVNGNNVRVMMPDKESYTALRLQLVAQNKRHRTFQPKDERAYKVVIKGLHHSTDREEIIEDLRRQGHAVRDLHNPIGRRTKEPLGIFFANLEPSSNNKDVYQVKRICRSVVTIEPPQKFNDVPQCFRCQGFGHTQRYCFLEYRCVKCGGPHESRACEKREDDKACCFHCQADHPASFKGCPAYKRAKALAAPKTRPVANANKAPPVASPNVTSGRSYRDALNGVHAAPQNPTTPVQTQTETPHSGQIEAMFARMEGMMERMMERMFTQMTQLVATILNSKSCN